MWVGSPRVQNRNYVICREKLTFMAYESWRRALNWPSLPPYIFLYMKKWRFRGVNYLLKSASLTIFKSRAQISRS